MFRKPEIEDFYQSLGSDEDVRALQVAVDDSPVMRPGQRARDLHSIAQDRIGGQSRAGAQLMQRFALDELHHDVEFAVALPYFVDGADVGMGQRRRSSCFLKQVLTCSLIEGGRLLDHFDRHIAVEHLVVRAIDGSHSTFTDHRHDAAVPKYLTDQNPSLKRCFNMLGGAWKSVNAALDTSAPLRQFATE